MKGISRIDFQHTHGWFVRVYREGVTHSKLFSDKKYGGKTQALKRAQAYRHLLEIQMPRTSTAKLR